MKNLNLQKNFNHSSLNLQSVKNFNTFPYNTVVKIISKFQNNTQLKGTGCLIEKSMVLTCAHLLHIRQNKLIDSSQIKKVTVYLSNNRKIKVKRWKIGRQYKNCLPKFTSMYDIAVLFLQQSNEIKQDQFLELKFIQNISTSYAQQKFQIVGYNFATGKNQPQNELTLKKFDKFIQFNYTWATYEGKTLSGMIGAPIIIIQQGKYKAIGMHIGFNQEFSNGIIFGESKSPFQIIAQLTDYKLIKKDLKSQISQKQKQDVYQESLRSLTPERSSNSSIQQKKNSRLKLSRIFFNKHQQFPKQILMDLATQKPQSSKSNYILAQKQKLLLILNPFDSKQKQMNLIANQQKGLYEQIRLDRQQNSQQNVKQNVLLQEQIKSKLQEENLFQIIGIKYHEILKNLTYPSSSFLSSFPLALRFVTIKFVTTLFELQIGKIPQNLSQKHLKIKQFIDSCQKKATQKIQQYQKNPTKASENTKIVTQKVKQCAKFLKQHQKKSFQEKLQYKDIIRCQFSNFLRQNIFLKMVLKYKELHLQILQKEQYNKNNQNTEKKVVFKKELIRFVIELIVFSYQLYRISSLAIGQLDQSRKKINEKIQTTLKSLELTSIDFLSLLDEQKLLQKLRELIPKCFQIQYTAKTKTFSLPQRSQSYFSLFLRRQLIMDLRQEQILQKSKQKNIWKDILKQLD